jgi:hypothetical protein
MAWHGAKFNMLEEVVFGLESYKSRDTILVRLELDTHCIRTPSHCNSLGYK